MNMPQINIKIKSKRIDMKKDDSATVFFLQLYNSDKVSFRLPLYR